MTNILTPAQRERLLNGALGKTPEEAAEMIVSWRSTIERFRAAKAADMDIGTEHEALLLAAEQKLAAFEAAWDVPG
jgi:hypothetical protein